jgi:arylsulfatase A-like enzyme
LADGGSPAGAIREGDWKLIEWYENDRRELFNIREDLSERHDRAADNLAKVTELPVQLEDWRKLVGAKMPTVNGRD